MKKTSLSARIAQRLKEVGGWVHKGQIEARAKEWGYLAETAGRRCREMESGISSSGKPCPILLEKKEINGSVLYRYKTKEVVISKFEVVDGCAIEKKMTVLA